MLDRNVFDEFLLNKIYETISNEMLNIFRKNNRINFVTNDSNNINQNRIINLFCNLNDIFYYFCNENISNVKHEIDVLIKWLNDKMKFYINENFSKINFYAIDIEFKMKNIYHVLNAQKKFKHIFWIFCDNHDFQLLMKNISKLSWFKKMFKKIFEIVFYFNFNSKQFIHFRNCQKQIYERHYFIMLSILTRWNIQMCNFSSFFYQQLIRANRFSQFFYTK